MTGRDVEPVPAKDSRERREPLRAPATQRERTFDREPQRNDRGGDRSDRHDRVERNERSDRNGRTFPTRSDPRDKGPLEKDRRNFDRSGYDRDYSGRGDRGDRYNVSILYKGVGQSVFNFSIFVSNRTVVKMKMILPNGFLEVLLLSMTPLSYVVLMKKKIGNNLLKSPIKEKQPKNDNQILERRKVKRLWLMALLVLAVDYLERPLKRTKPKQLMFKGIP